MSWASTSSRSVTRMVAGLFALIIIGIPAGIAWAETHSVAVVDSAYQPASITVTVGDTVQWTHQGSMPHTVTASDGSWDSHPDCGSFGDDCMMGGDTYSQDFTEVGEFTYYCKLHGTAGGQGMAGTVTVQAAQSSDDGGAGDDTGGDTGGDTGSDTGGDTGSDTGGDTGSDTDGGTDGGTGGSADTAGDDSAQADESGSADGASDELPETGVDVSSLVVGALAGAVALVAGLALLRRRGEVPTA